MEVATQSTPFLLTRRRTRHTCSLEARGLRPSLDRLHQHREGEGEYTLVVTGQPEVARAYPNDQITDVLIVEVDGEDASMISGSADLDLVFAGQRERGVRQH